MRSRKRISNTWWIWAVAIIIILVIIVVYVGSLGTVNLTSKNPLPDEFKDTKEEAIKLHKELEVHLAEKVALMKKLTRRFKISFLVVRILLVALWCFMLYGFYYFGLILNLEDVLNYSEASLIVIVLANFITFGSFRNMHDFLSNIRIRIENWVWSKNLYLAEEIDRRKAELDALALSIQAAAIEAATAGPPSRGADRTDGMVNATQETE